MTRLAISAKGLTRTFDDFIAVDRLDLSIEEKTIFGFLGPNGSGKSTTLRMWGFYRLADAQPWRYQCFGTDHSKTG
ncbi:MAG: ATP-binding cassette domain-containing protein [Endozoicomonas sp.]|uniref:ATP-binding cassette domain-containing protein n=1 Tax=Endozoicomonas sp. TaxID=1892382 RepID=UPI003D9B9D0F